MRKILTLGSLVALAFAPVAFAADSAIDSGSYSVAGESQDNGLGHLPANYTAAEFQRGYHVAGESQDSGLGDLPGSYTAAEFQVVGYHVVGEKLDSGLGSLSFSTY
jgi:hypothetical protein